MKRLLVFLIFVILLCGSATYGQNVLATKTVNVTITKPNALAAFQETWGTSSSDLMNVTTLAFGGSNLMVCISARQQNFSIAPASRYFGIQVLNSLGSEVLFAHIGGIGQPGAKDFMGSGCMYWAPPVTDTYTFKLLTFHDAAGADLIWNVNRQIFVVELGALQQR